MPYDACGASRFGFGYQRADLDVKGPPIYAALSGGGDDERCETLYTASGMSAIAATLTGLLRVRAGLTVFTARGGHSETRELLESLGAHVTVDHRTAGADLPRPTIDAIGDAIADWWAPHRIGRSVSSSAGATLQPAPLP